MTRSWTASVAAPDLRRALDHVLRVASRDPKLLNLQDVLFELDVSRLRVVATDRLRLAVSELAISDLAMSGHPAPSAALVPTAWLDSLTIDDRAGPVGVFVNDNSFRLAISGAQQSTPTAAGDFPDYHAFLALPTDAATLIVDRARLIEAIEEHDDGEPLQLTVADDLLTVGQHDPIAVPAAYRGSAFSFYLNPVFAHDAAEAAGGEEIALDLVDPLHPVAFRNPAGAIHVTVVMPIRISEPRPRRRRG